MEFNAKLRTDVSIQCYTFRSIDYNPTILFDCILDFDQVMKYPLSQPNILSGGRQSLDKSYLYCNSSPTFDDFALHIT
jgi:hypothetical protein